MGDSLSTDFDGPSASNKGGTERVASGKKLAISLLLNEITEITEREWKLASGTVWYISYVTSWLLNKIEFNIKAFTLSSFIISLFYEDQKLF